MPKFFVDYTKTQVTRERVVIEAESQEEAVRLVEEYEFDNSEAWEIESIEWSIDNVEAVTGAMA